MPVTIDRAETGWIQTYTGRKFHPMAPDPEEICIEDIAHALSNLCRFNGHCQRFYSVAQHSVLVSQNVPEVDRKWALLHDAAEAYLVDLPRPVKQWLRSQGCKIFDEMEAKLMVAICTRFGLSLVEPPAVHGADQLLLVTEARDVMGPLHPDWRYWIGNGYPALPETILPWEPWQAEFMFLSAWHHLEGENHDQ